MTAQQDGGETDEALAVLAGSGDRRAFERLVTRHRTALYRFARRYVGASDEAYDIVQESLVSAWGALGRYDPSRPFGAWLRAITLNKCRDHGRRGATRRLFLKAFAAGRSPVSDAQADQQARQDKSEAEARLARLDIAIAALPRAYKEPLLLTLVEGLSHQAAAAQLGISPKAVEMRLYRARQTLTEWLGEG
ncbi:MAG: RNA polymerase sigma factor [Caulobacteraceae bacterium]|nr:RNA polymerase sigma factor [Caulobacteraceae bacterium]